MKNNMSAYGGRKYFLIIAALTLLFAPAVYAATPFEYHVVPECALSADAICSVCDIVNAAIAFARSILFAMSGMTLLMFIIGGFYWIVSSGNEERVTKGKKIITAAIVGLFIVAFAWVGVNTIIGALLGRTITNMDSSITLKNQNKPWWQFPACATKSVLAVECVNAEAGTFCDNCTFGTPTLATGSEKCVCGLNKSQQMGCISLCEQIAVQNSTVYGDYTCIDTSKVSAETEAWTILGAESCLVGDLCPHAKGADPIYKCCRPAD